MPSTHFGLSDRIDLAFFVWPEGGVVHEAFSNDTYRLSDDAIVLLRALAAAGPSDVDTLTAAAGAGQHRVEELLQELQRLGLVEPC